MLVSVVGTRPNFVKMAPVIKELKRRGVGQLVVHTGQHASPEMSDRYLRALDFPEPDICLKIDAAHAGSHARQTAQIMCAFEDVCLKHSPSLVIVAGDVNSTLACALAAAKLNIPVAHIEAGLRSFDRNMPEEINRVLTDRLSELLFTTERSAEINLKREDIDPEKIHFAGNTMIDSLETWLREDVFSSRLAGELKLQPDGYAVATLHRPENVDDPQSLGRLAGALEFLASRLPVVFPVHPRTRSRMEKYGTVFRRVTAVAPLDYPEFIRLLPSARLVLTDSGGVQEETSFLGVPCLTLRENTERPVTVELGTNRLVGTDPERIVRAAEELISKAPERSRPEIPLWDGKAAARVADVIERWAGNLRPPSTI